MTGKKYNLSLEQIKNIYEALATLDNFAELKIGANYQYRLTRLRDYLEGAYKAFSKFRDQCKKKYKKADGKIDPVAFTEAIEKILQSNYEGVLIPELTLSGLCTKDDSLNHKIAVPHVVIKALSFHIKDDIGAIESDMFKEPLKIKIPDLEEEVILEENHKE